MALLSGCDEVTDKKRVTVSVWDESLIGTPFTQKVEELNPDFDIYWICGKDDGDFYRFQNEHGSMPDVLLVKHLDEDDELGSILFDLADTDVVELRSQRVLSAVPGNGPGESEGDTVILPADDAFTGLLANKYLFETYDVPFPSNRQELISAVEAFKEKGMAGIVGGFSDEETLFEFSQTTLSDFPNTEEGSLWRQGLRAGKTQDVLDDAWLPFYEDVQQALSLGVLDPAELDQDADQARQRFVNGDAAMLFVSGDDLARYTDELHMTVRALPNFSVDGDGTWLLVRPAFYGAVSYVDGKEADVASSEEIHENALTVLNSIMSPEAQQAYFDTLGMSVPASVLLVDQEGSDAARLPAMEYVTESAKQGSFQLAVTDPDIMEATASAIEWAAKGGAEEQLAKEVSRSQEGSSETGQDAQADSEAQPNQDGQSDAGNQDAQSGKGGQSDADNQNAQGAQSVHSDQASVPTNPAGSNAQMAEEEAMSFDLATMQGIASPDAETFKEQREASVATCTLAYADEQLESLRNADSRVMASFPEGMSNIWNDERGVMAANSVGRTVSREMGTDFFVLSPYAIACPLYADDMTVTELAYPINDLALYRAQLSGAQLKELIAQHVGSVSDGKELWALAGLKMVLAGDGDGFALDDLQAVTGQEGDEKASPAGQTDTAQVEVEPIEDSHVYEVGFALKPGSKNEQLLSGYGAERQDSALSDVWVSYFVGPEGGSLLASQDYLDVKPAT